MADKNNNYVLALMAMILLLVFLSGCTKTYYYKVAEEKVQYEFGEIDFYIYDLERAIIQGKTEKFYEDSVYNVYDSRAFRFKNVPFDSSKFVYLSLSNRNYSQVSNFIFQTYLIADSINIIPKSLFEFPKYDGLKQITLKTGRTSKTMWIEPILVPKDYKDDFEIEYILSVYRESDSTLLMRKPVKLKIKYRSRYYSPFIQGR